MQKLLACLIITTVMYSCGVDQLGKQFPENVMFMASADGSVITRQYSVYHVTSFKQEGGKTERHGYSTNYLEVYDGATGQLLSSKPYITKENCRLLKVTKSYVWLGVYNRESSAFQLLVLEIPGFAKVLDEKILAEKNNGLIFNTNATYYNPQGIQGVIVQADDARIYAIDEKTGLASQVPDTIKTRMINQRYLRISNLRLPDRYLNFTGNQRKKLISKMNDRKNAIGEILSETDFINPFIAGYYVPETEKEMPLSVVNGFLVVSKTKDSNAFEFQFTLLDSATLKRIWTAVLKNEKTENNENDLQDIQLHDHGIVVITKNSMNLLNPKTGDWKWNKSFD